MTAHNQSHQQTNVRYWSRLDMVAWAIRATKIPKGVKPSTVMTSMDAKIYTFKNGASYLDSRLASSSATVSYTCRTLRASDAITPEITSILKSEDPEGAIDWRNDSISFGGISYPVQLACTYVKQSRYWTLGEGHWKVSYQESLNAWKVLEFVDSGNGRHDPLYTGNSATFDSYRKNTFGKDQPAAITTKGIREKDIPAVILILIYSEIRRINTPKKWDETIFRWVDKTFMGAGWSGAVRSQA